MPQSLSCILVHIIFSTKNRVPFIDASLEKELHPYMSSIFNTLGCPARALNGTMDHVHILCSMSRTRTIADVVEEAKTGSSKWAKTKGPQYRKFYWQKGYGAFSIGASGERDLKEYIARQKEKHVRKTFQDEFRSFLKLYNVPYDEKFVWE